MTTDTPIPEPSPERRTPRTEAFYKSTPTYRIGKTGWEWARQLERGLAEARAEVEVVKIWLKETEMQVADLIRQRDSMDAANTRLNEELRAHAPALRMAVECLEDVSSKIHDAANGRINWRQDFAYRADDLLPKLRALLAPAHTATVAGNGGREVLS